MSDTPQEYTNDQPVMEYFWMSALKEKLIHRSNSYPLPFANESSMLTHHFPAAELWITEKERKAIEKEKQGRRIWLIKDINSQNYYLVKQDLKKIRLVNEYAINTELVRRQTPHVFGALCYFASKQEVDGTQEFGWLAFIWVRSFTLGSVRKLSSLDYIATSRPYKWINLGEWLNGLVSMLELLDFTNPDRVGNPLKLYHKDLHEEQIIFELKQRNWYLIDFGHAELTYMSQPDTVSGIPETETKIVSSSSYSSSHEEMEKVFKMFLNGLYKVVRADLYQKIKHCSSLGRHEALLALRKIIAEDVTPDLAAQHFEFTTWTQMDKNTSSTPSSI